MWVQKVIYIAILVYVSGIDVKVIYRSVGEYMKSHTKFNQVKLN